MIKLRFLLAWGNYGKGAVIEPPATLRQQLLATRFYGRPVVEEFQDDQAKAEPPVKVRFLLAWGNYPKGAVVAVPPATRKQLLATCFYGRRVIEEVNEEPAELNPLPALPAVAPKRRGQRDSRAE